MSTSRRRIILDCDPGRDDAIAIAMAIASSAEIDVAGITAVAGNVPLEVTYRNARFLCELCGFPDTPVHAGADRPLVREPVTATRHHGESGLEGVEVTMPADPIGSRPAVGFIADTLRAAGDGEITLVAIGPFTNVALFAREHPDLLAKVREIVVMGGASTAGGNVTPAAEFNVYADPHAAEIVFECGRPLTVHGLDVTHQVLAAPRHAERLAAAGGGRGAAARPPPSPRGGEPGPPLRAGPLAAPRSVHHRMAAPPGAVRDPDGPRRRRDRGDARVRRDGGRLVGGDGTRAQRPLGDRGRRRSVARPRRRSRRPPLIRPRHLPRNRESAKEVLPGFAGGCDALLHRGASACRSAPMPAATRAADSFTESRARWA